jgi:hypothetical protein
MPARLALVFALALLVVLAADPAQQPRAEAVAVSCDVNATPANAQQRISAAGPGTVICLAQGVYDKLTIFQKSDIFLHGAGRGRTVIVDDPTNNTCLSINGSHDIWVMHLTAYACRVQGIFVGDSTGVLLKDVETAAGPLGIQFRNSTGTISESRAHGHDAVSGAAFGSIIQNGSNVTISKSVFDHNAGFGILAQNNATLFVNDSWITSNVDGGVFTLRSTGRTTINRSTIHANDINIFAGMPGCAGLPAANSAPPPCYTSNPGAYYSQIVFKMNDSVVAASHGTGIVFFPGVHATLRRNLIQDAGLTGLFAWGPRLNAQYDRFLRNRENAVECRAYPAPDTGDRGVCDVERAVIKSSRPLSGNRLGGGFVSEGANFHLRWSWVEYNWGVGVQALNHSAGGIRGNVIRHNGGTALCISESPTVVILENTMHSNRPGTCKGHP